ncbi:MAG TPA: ROK family glucokinase [Dermatophilaceae bacterium]|nr:ROK family glucokinase [Dermatophilaceae bacterium]
MNLTVGLDVGGTKISGTLVGADGRVRASAWRLTPASGTEDILAAAADVVAELRSALHPPDHLTGIGVACAGFIDRDGARVLFAPNLPWRDEPLKQRLEGVVGLPVVVENDANAAAWGEFTHGSAATSRDMVLITVGTGVGGGVIADGRLLRGAHGIAAELGHLRVVPEGLRCGCGNRGCWEQYASGTALVREARDLVSSGSPLARELMEACEGKPKRLTGPDVTRLAVAGDPASIELIADLGRWLGEGAASIAAVLDPDVVVLGGGVSAAGNLLLDPARAAFRRHLTGRGYRPEASWELAALGNDAGMIGAAALARDGTAR